MDAREIYDHHPDRYDALVRAEDVAGNLPALLGELCPLTGRRVVEVGAGTGRVTRLLLEGGAARVLASDRAVAMLRFGRQALGEDARLRRFVADGQALPLPSRVAELGIAGWVFGHLRYWLPDDWRASIGQALDELQRCVGPDGSLIVIETLGTAAKQAAPPSSALAEYYAFLEQERGFTRHTIRTDYRFASTADAVEICTFFFGEELGARVRESGSAAVREFTGVWHRGGDLRSRRLVR